MLNNKKTKFIILAIVIFSLLSIFFVFKKINNKNSEESKKENKIDILQELKENHPEFSTEQIKNYQEIANNKETKISTCFEKEDEENCITSVAFIRNDKGLCYIHDHDSHEHKNEEDEEKTLKKCVNDILRKNAVVEIEKCQLLNGDDFFNCLNDIFNDTYNKQEDCGGLLEKEAKIICEEMFNYKEAYLKYNRALCVKIKNEKLNQYCLKNIIDKSQDSDKDGLTDLEEINKYKTHYLFPDSDQDNLLDGDEVKNGFDPTKAGKLK